MDNLTHWKQTRQNVEYLGSCDLIAGADKDGKPVYKDIVATVSKVVLDEEVTEPVTNKKKYCVVVYFKEQNIKKLIVNSTNKKNISKATQNEFIENWVGHKITISTQSGVRKVGVKKGDPDEFTTAIRVKPIPPVVKMLKCECCGKEIQEEVFNGTKEKCNFGVCSIECRDKMTNRGE